MHTVLVFHGLTRHRMEEISNYPLSCAREFSCVVGGQHLERQRAKKTGARTCASRTMSFLSKKLIEEPENLKQILRALSGR